PRHIQVEHDQIRFLGHCSVRGTGAFAQAVERLLATPAPFYWVDEVVFSEAAKCCLVVILVVFDQHDPDWGRHDSSLLKIFNAKIECGADPDFGLEPDRASLSLNDFLHEGQADAATSDPVIIFVKALEDSKDIAMKMRRDADTVLAHIE